MTGGIHCDMVVRFLLRELPPTAEIARGRGALGNLRDAVCRAYKNIGFLPDDSSLRESDLDLVHTGAASSLVELTLSQLKQKDMVLDGVSPSFLKRHSPPAFPEWSTKPLRDAFHATRRFPRLLKPDAVTDTVSRGLGTVTIAYVVKASDDTYESFRYKRSLSISDVAAADDVYLTARELAEECVPRKTAPVPALLLGAQPRPVDSPQPAQQPPLGSPAGGTAEAFGSPFEPPPRLQIAGFQWTREMSPQKWMSFRTKALSFFATAGSLMLTVTVDVEASGGAEITNVEETKLALRELGLTENVSVEREVRS
jgi:hypothetical protein